MIRLLVWHRRQLSARLCFVLCVSPVPLVHCHISWRCPQASGFVIICVQSDVISVTSRFADNDSDEIQTMKFRIRLPKKSSHQNAARGKRAILANWRPNSAERRELQRTCLQLTSFLFDDNLTHFTDTHIHSNRLIRFTISIVTKRHRTCYIATLSLWSTTGFDLRLTFVWIHDHNGTSDMSKTWNVHHNVRKLSGFCNDDSSGKSNINYVCLIPITKVTIQRNAAPAERLAAILVNVTAKIDGLLRATLTCTSTLCNATGRRLFVSRVMRIIGFIHLDENVHVRCQHRQTDRHQMIENDESVDKNVLISCHSTMT